MAAPQVPAQTPEIVQDDDGDQSDSDQGGSDQGTDEDTGTEDTGTDQGTDEDTGTDQGTGEDTGTDQGTGEDTGTGESMDPVAEYNQLLGLVNIARLANGLDALKGGIPFEDFTACVAAGLPCLYQNFPELFEPAQQG
ncbi:hypothetical protein [Streptomyces atratus]|uniref:hypothetical protein n=1 Tax=Streptomyces atratus TaxID=1893 RepID=UPI0036624DCB